MINSVQRHQHKPKTHSAIRPLRSAPTALPEADHLKLKEYLEDCERGVIGGSGLLAYVLSTKLMNTAPVTGVHLSDVVAGGCLVTYSVNGEKPQTGILVHTEPADSTAGMIAVASLLGATLIGMRVGQRAPLLHEDGTIARLLVTDVEPSKSPIATS